jgi:hypothetical protein
MIVEAESKNRRLSSDYQAAENGATLFAHGAGAAVPGESYTIRSLPRSTVVDHYLESAL